MKLKISHQFYQNLLNKTYLREILTISLFLFLVKGANATGLYTGFFQDINLQKEKFQVLLKRYINNNLDLKSIKDLSEVKLNQEYLTFILSNSPSRYTSFASTDKCSLYDLLNTNLLRSPIGEIDRLLITYKNKDGQFETRLIKKNLFLDRVVPYQCPKFKEFSQHFNANNLRNTLKKIKIQIPQTEKECIQNITTFQNDVKSPYLCQIAETVKASKKNEIRYTNMSSAQKARNTDLLYKIELAKSYQRIFTKLGLETITGYCENLAQPILYCRNFFRSNLWSKIYKKDPKSILFKTYCTEKNIKDCLIKINSEDFNCHFRGEKNTSLFPKQNCKSLSSSLMKNRLNLNYEDCPSVIKNESMINISRLLNHLFPDDIKSNKSCNLNTIYPFAKFNKDFLDYDSWQVKICYNDTLIGNDKVCLPTIFGEADNSPLSISNVIQKITYRLKGNNSKCKIIDKRDYNPTLLEFKAGCYIINDFKQCSGEDCKFTVLLDGKPFDKFKIDYNLNFDFFPTNYLTENKSIMKQMSKHLKKEFKSVKNTTVLKRYLEMNKKVVVVGTGCAEDILPSFFQRESLNQCHPVGIIIDQLIEKDGLFSVQLRTTMDHIQAPRIVSWQNVFTGIKQYQKIHPLNSWELYAFY